MSTYDVGQMLINLNESMPMIFKMLTGGAFVFGIVFIIASFHHFKVYSDSRGSNNSQSTIFPPLIYLFVGMIFMYLPTTLSLTMTTFFGYDSILAYDAWGGSSNISDSVLVVVRIIQAVGLISFFRGWIIVAKSSKGQQQANSGLGKGFVHILAGIFALNIIGTLEILSNTFGINF